MSVQESSYIQMFVVCLLEQLFKTNHSCYSNNEQISASLFLLNKQVITV